MAASDLQDRLEYLVSYSSQLMFISSDIARQSNILDSFIAQSTEQIEVALLAAVTTTPLAKYREKLYQQLISKTQSADFNRPLNQLLAELNHHDGPIIISITKGENLPNKLVKELWDLVLQSRFTSNKQHLNVLIFSQGPWARVTQRLLSSKSGDKPLLINTLTSVDSLQTELNSDLDKLIASKRKKFAERLQQRAQKPQTPIVFLKRKSVIVAFILVFISLFIAILSWQYPEQFNFLIEGKQSSLTVNQPIQSVKETQTKELAISSTQDKQETAEIKAEVLPVLLMPEIVEPPLPEADLLVTDWQSAIAQVEIKSAQFLQDKSELALRNDSHELNQSIEASIIIENLAPPTLSEVDNKIAPSELGKEAATQSKISLQTPLPVTLEKGTYYIQLLAMADYALLQQNIDEQKISEQSWTYETQRFGGNWHVLLLAQSYPSFAAAKAAIDVLPANLLTQSPFVKSANTIQQEIAANMR
jgi:DamX protein